MYNREDTKFQTKVEKYAIPIEKEFTVDDLGIALSFNIFHKDENGKFFAVP